MLLYQKEDVLTINSNSYIVNRIIELCNDNNTVEDICEIIGSERSLEKVFLSEDIKSYIANWEKFGLINIKNNYLSLNRELYDLVNKSNNVPDNTMGLTRVLWDITRKCNLHCHHCYAYKDNNEANELSFSEVCQVLTQLKELAPYLIVYGGGEPFMRTDFIDILQKTKEIIGCRIKILTNGSLITKGLLKKIKPYVDFIQYSLDGQKDSHLRLRNNNHSFESVLNAIELSRNEGIHTGICMTINKYNIKDIDWMVQFALQNKVYKLRISPFVAAGKAVQNYKDWVIPPEEIAKLYKQLLEYRLKYQDQLLFDFRDELYGHVFLTGRLKDKKHEHSNYFLCAAGRSLFYINAEGFVTPCNFIDHQSYMVGNVKTESIIDMWNHSSLFKELRDLHVNEIENCSTCHRKHLCGGGLRCNAVSISNDFKAADPFCYFYEEASN